MGRGDARVADPRLELLAEFQRNLEQERRLSAHTSSNYRRDIEALLGLTAGVALESITQQAIQRAVAQLHARGLSGKTLARMLSAWRGFFGLAGAPPWFSRQSRCRGARAEEPEATSSGALARCRRRAPGDRP